MYVLYLPSMVCRCRYEDLLRLLVGGNVSISTSPPEVGSHGVACAVTIGGEVGKVQSNKVVMHSTLLTTRVNVLSRLGSQGDADDNAMWHYYRVYGVLCAVLEQSLMDVCMRVCTHACRNHVSPRFFTWHTYEWSTVHTSMSICIP
jgi:hypothetical protein